MEVEDSDNCWFSSIFLMESVCNGNRFLLIWYVSQYRRRDLVYFIVLTNYLNGSDTPNLRKNHSTSFLSSPRFPDRGERCNSLLGFVNRNEVSRYILRLQKHFRYDVGLKSETGLNEKWEEDNQNWSSGRVLFTDFHIESEFHTKVDLDRTWFITTFNSDICILKRLSFFSSFSSFLRPHSVFFIINLFSFSYWTIHGTDL